MLFPEAAPPPVGDGRVRVGTSGYSFADWIGPFYPRGIRPADQLRYYAARFDLLEVNVTYYRIPDAKLMAGMEARTPPGFAFLVKLYGELTHERHLDGDLVRGVASALEPLRAAGKLRGLLAQFPQSFHNDENNRAHLARLRDAFPADDLFVEFRHRDWVQAPVFEFLRGLKLGYVSVDEPDLPGLVPDITRVTNGIGYVRLHGRNATNWHAQGRGHSDRYDYLYSDEELREWAAKIRRMMDEARQVFVLFNNCHAGQAPANAQAMKELLQQLP
jgi:uncharacterized protein YecE (DUF72 family)